jgi:hypothetical protein
MTRREVPLVVAMLAGLLAGCTDPRPDHPNQRPSYGPDVVHLGGVADIGFGDSLDELSRRGALVPQRESCGPRLTSLPTVSPVFANERLVLVWIDPPVRTPEGVTVGTSLAEARAAYPHARDLAAPPDSYRFDGLLVEEGDRAYLFLHDGQTVRKAVAGYTEYVRRLFEDGFGTC